MCRIACSSLFFSGLLAVTPLTGWAGRFVPPPSSSRGMKAGESFRCLRRVGSPGCGTVAPTTPTPPVATPVSAGDLPQCRFAIRARKARSRDRLAAGARDWRQPRSAIKGHGASVRLLLSGGWPATSQACSRWIRSHRSGVARLAGASAPVRRGGPGAVPPDGSIAHSLRWPQGLHIVLAPLLPSQINVCRSDVKFLDDASRAVLPVLQRCSTHAGLREGRTGLLLNDSTHLLWCGPWPR